MTDAGSRKADDVKGVAATGEGDTAEPARWDNRLLPGGSIEDAARAVGMNAVDREMLPSHGTSRERVDYGDRPDEHRGTRKAGPE